MRSPCTGATIVCSKKTLPKAKLQAHLAKLRNGKMSHWQVVGSQSVQAITDRLYLAWEAFFRGDIKRPPTFRKRRKYRSFTLKQCGYKVLGHGRIKILGQNYRFNQSRPVTGTIKTVIFHCAVIIANKTPEKAAIEPTLKPIFDSLKN